MKGRRYVCVHGHFYQPPREDPWLESVERQESAWPAHDWNERVSDECYAPNAHARILGEARRIVAIENNYARLSFNFGPTLLSWMEEERPALYQAILEADVESAARFGGHGSAIAQVYNHMIMPLASERDRRTQVAWGLRDFERRFGRPSEGMWLAETAVDIATLEALAEEGVKYTILAPHQCARVRPKGGAWTSVTGQRVDPRRPYEAVLPSGRRITLFFYDGPTSRAVAFERLLHDGHGFATRLIDTFDERAEPQLAHIATDGETYGHHHRYGEMALAVALRRLEEDESIFLVNYGQFLEHHPPAWEAEIVEDTSWSCSHGVERWRSDCGCSSGTGWHQRWRAPLREALDWLRDELAARFGASDHFTDPWAARDAYIDVVLDRSKGSVDAFLGAQAARPLGAEARGRALRLLEMQRHAMLMYTSCGWFFDEPSGLETVQILRYAARAIQLATDLFGDLFASAFRERLGAAPSNVEEYGDADGIYETFVEPSRVDLSRVAAHFAIASAFGGGSTLTPRGFDAEMVEHDVDRAGGSCLCTGRLRVRSRTTEEAEDYSFAMVHFGDHNVLGGLRPFEHVSEHLGMHGALSRPFGRADLSEVLRQIERTFDGATFSLQNLFHDEQSAVLDRLLDDRRAEIEGTYESIYERSASLLRFLGSLGQKPPAAFRAAAEYTIRTRLRRAVAEGPSIDLERVTRLLQDAAEADVALDPMELGVALEGTLAGLVGALRADPDDLPLLVLLADVAAFVHESPWKMDLGEAQNGVWRLLQDAPAVWRARDDTEDAERLATLARVARQLEIEVGW